MNPAAMRPARDSISRAPGGAGGAPSSVRPRSVMDIEHASPPFHDLCERYRQIDARTRTLCIHMREGYNRRTPMLRRIVAVELEILRRQRDRLLQEIVAVWRDGATPGEMPGARRNERRRDH